MLTIVSTFRSLVWSCILLHSLGSCHVLSKHQSFKFKRKNIAHAGKDDDVKGHIKDYWSASLGFVELLSIPSKICSGMLLNLSMLISSQLLNS
jgi:hypothetical protein